MTVTQSAEKPRSTSAGAKPRVFIEEWLPAAAIGVECMRERGSASALAPHTYLHVWWARRPLTAARAAVLGSLLPPDRVRIARAALDVIGELPATAGAGRLGLAAQLSRVHQDADHAFVG